MRTLVFLVLVILPAVVMVIIFSVFALQDYRQLIAAYTNFQHLAVQHAGMTELFVADAAQNVHRINLFADGTWVLLAAIYGSIGLHGIYMLKAQRSN